MQEFVIVVVFFLFLFFFFVFFFFVFFFVVVFVCLFVCLFVVVVCLFLFCFLFCFCFLLLFFLLLFFFFFFFFFSNALNMFLFNLLVLQISTFTEMCKTVCLNYCTLFNPTIRSHYPTKLLFNKSILLSVVVSKSSWMSGKQCRP